MCALYSAGNIYSDVLEKRLDNSSFLMANDLQKAFIENGQLCFEERNNFKKALKEGIFMLKIPENFDPTEADQFAQTFYLGEDKKEMHYGHFKKYNSEIFKDSLLGFHQRVDQIEQFLLEKRFWNEWYPEPISRIAYQLCDISSIIIKTILKTVGIRIEDYDKATGGCATKEGSYHLTFNHYRPALKKNGLSSHKDDGFVTILRTVSPGLEVNRYDKWEMVATNKNYFIINFGLAMEILTRNSSCPVSAIMHRVSRQSQDRWSWGHFSSSQCSNNNDMGIYEYSDEQGLQKICNSRELINNNDYEIYFGLNKNS
jgi:hypothetical protein